MLGIAAPTPPSAFALNEPPTRTDTMATPSQQPATQLGDHNDPHHAQFLDEHKVGQQTPPNSADGKKTASDGVPSELSELDLENNGAQDPIAEGSMVDDIEPDHYYGGGKIPVFKPVG